MASQAALSVFLAPPSLTVKSRQHSPCSHTDSTTQTKQITHKKRWGKKHSCLKEIFGKNRLHMEG